MYFFLPSAMGKVAWRIVSQVQQACPAPWAGAVPGPLAKPSGGDHACIHLLNLRDAVSAK
jgi:hypothetical protein